jgi:glycine cleavage system H protein
LFAPVSGTVTEINEALNTAPEQVNKDANTTWMIKVKLKDAGEAAKLLSGADYEKFIAEEGGH